MQAQPDANAPVAETFAKILSGKEVWSDRHNTRFSITIGGVRNTVD